jgi:hypothetical protein
MRATFFGGGRIDCYCFPVFARRLRRLPNLILVGDHFRRLTDFGASLEMGLAMWASWGGADKRSG